MKTQTIINRYYLKAKDSYKFTREHQIELGRMLYEAHVHEIGYFEWGKWCKKLVFGLCPLCGEQIQENQLLDEADEIVNAVYLTDNEPILAA